MRERWNGQSRTGMRFGFVLGSLNLCEHSNSIQFLIDVMKTIPVSSFVAAVLGAGVLSLASCTAPYAADNGGSPLRTSGAYSAQSHGAGSTYHSRDRRDPDGDWRHDDNERGGPVAYTAYSERDHRYTTARVWSPGMGPAALPNGARRVEVDGRVYYSAGNVWYQPVGTGFKVVASPY